MNRLKLVLLVAALALPASSTQALEWDDYDGTIPDNAVLFNEATDMGSYPICGNNARMGIVNVATGDCHTLALVSSRTMDFSQEEGYQILVDNSESEIEAESADLGDAVSTPSLSSFVVEECPHDECSLRKGHE